MTSRIQPMKLPIGAPWKIKRRSMDARHLVCEQSPAVTAKGPNDSVSYMRDDPIHDD
jgi:hypothetical protein